MNITLSENKLSTDTLVPAPNYNDYYDRLHILYKGQRPWVYSDNQYTYKVISDTMSSGGRTISNTAIIKRVEVYTKKEGKLLQTLLTEEENYFEFFHDSSNLVGFDDVNFDGFTDIRILTWTSANWQTKYQFWIYDPDSHQFRDHPELKELWNPCFDQVRKTIHTHWRKGFNDMGHALYRWNGNKLEVLAEEYETMGIEENKPGQYVKAEIVDGNWVETEREIREFSIDYNHECDSCKLHREK